MSSSPNRRSKTELSQQTDSDSDVNGVKREKSKRIGKTESETSLKSIVYNRKPILKRDSKTFSLTNLVTECCDSEAKIALEIVTFIIPVSVCAAFVLLSVSCLPFLAQSINYSSLIPGVTIPIDSESASTRDKTLSAIIFAVIFVCVMFLLTTCVAVLMVRGWFGGLNTIFIISMVLNLSLSSIYYINVMFRAFNTAIDIFSVFFMVLNYTAVGVIVLCTKTKPKILERAYRVLISATAVLFLIKLLPSWSTWILLFLMTLLDIYEVFIGLTIAIMVNAILIEYFLISMPGPLKTIIDVEGSDNVYLPIYSAIVRVIDDKKRDESTTGEDESDYEMGLGDFVLYSLLISKSYATCSALSAIMCYVGVIFGMIVTHLMLIYLEKAVPALPVSIYLGLIFHFSAVWLIVPFNDSLIIGQIFI